jgi:hypothetical protein
MDIRAATAREENRLAAEDERSAGLHREKRDSLVRQLRAEDPGRWTYTALAKAVDCSPELIAHIVKSAQAIPG